MTLLPSNSFSSLLMMGVESVTVLSSPLSSLIRNVGKRTGLGVSISKSSNAPPLSKSSPGFPQIISYGICLYLKRAIIFLV